MRIFVQIKYIYNYIFYYIVCFNCFCDIPITVKYRIRGDKILSFYNRDTALGIYIIIYVGIILMYNIFAAAFF